MPRKESLYPQDWLKIAEKDLKRVKQLLKLKDAEASGFYLQQALEKLFKAFLLKKGWQLQRIHDLEPLLNEALKHDSSLEQYRLILQRITAYYVFERYPFAIESGLKVAEIAESLIRVKTLIVKLRSGIIK